MKLKTILQEDFSNYKLPSMFIGTSKCTWKCCLEQNLDKEICQNSVLAQQKDIDISNEEIYNMYISNLITKSIVLGGLEPMLQFDEVLNLIQYFREKGCLDTFVIYTGYYYDEITENVKQLQEYPNIVIKYGRYIPNHKPHHDKILGVDLISNNQYAEVIS